MKDNLLLGINYRLTFLKRVANSLALTGTSLWQVKISPLVFGDTKEEYLRWG